MAQTVGNQGKHRKFECSVLTDNGMFYPLASSSSCSHDTVDIFLTHLQALVVVAEIG